MGSLERVEGNIFERGSNGGTTAAFVLQQSCRGDIERGSNLGARFSDDVDRPLGDEDLVTGAQLGDARLDLLRREAVRHGRVHLLARQLV
eukprot:4533553-Pyramimonas_sp.AAC.1